MPLDRLLSILRLLSLAERKTILQAWIDAILSR
jgi:hypothetical protein